MGSPMFDLGLLRSFVSVVDSGGFTRAGERVHRTQSTVSHQIKRLEDDVGQPLLNRTGKEVTPTEAGERLLSYARRLLALAEEARDVLARPGNEGAVRLGVPEDFAAYRLAKLLASFSRSHPGLRLDVRADQSTYLRRDLERGELDLALFKRAAGEKGGIAVWPERVHWVTSKSHPRDAGTGSVPFATGPATPQQPLRICFTASCDAPLRNSRTMRRIRSTNSVTAPARKAGGGGNIRSSVK